MSERVRLVRTLRAPVAEVWALWTTVDGIESWWGPDGFAVTVVHLDLRPGGELRYLMRAETPAMREFMRREGMPEAHPARLVYREVVPEHRLAYLHDVDFVPGVAAYQIETVVELHVVAGAVRMTVEFDPMHDPTWTARATAGWTSELDKLERRLSR